MAPKRLVFFGWAEIHGAPLEQSDTALEQLMYRCKNVDHAWHVALASVKLL
jgi:hypothetical protein